MDFLKNKQVVKDKQEEIKKATALRAQGRGSSIVPPHVSKNRKYPSDLQSSGKSANGPSIRLKARKVASDTPCHGIRKGLITSQGPITPPPLPLLVKDKEYAVDTAGSIIRYADLDECLEHETDHSGDSGLFDMMRVCYVSIPFVPF